MTTNQVMQRSIGNIPIYQRTKDGFFNATSLLNSWNDLNGMQKQMVHYFDNSSTKEFLDTIMARENLKERNSVFITSRGKNGGTWMHPLLFIDFAMWINPSFKYDVLKFVYDQMIKFRNDSGDAYRELSSAMASITPKCDMPAHMAKVAEALNWVAFNEHYPNARNSHGSEEDMHNLFQLEKDVTLLIKVGHLKTLDDIIIYLRKLWYERYSPKVLNP